MSTKAKVTEIINGKIAALQVKAAGITDDIAATDTWLDRSTRPVHVHGAVKKLMASEGLTNERATAAMLAAAAIKQCEAELAGIHLQIAEMQRHLARLDQVALS